MLNNLVVISWRKLCCNPAHSFTLRDILIPYLKLTFREGSKKLQVPNLQICTWNFKGVVVECVSRGYEYNPLHG
jgi:hypothetical protein